MMETIGQTIKRLRKEHNFTQEALAQQLGVTFQTVSKWENGYGMPDISQIVPLATVLEVSTDVLFGFCAADSSEEVIRLIHDAQALVDPLSLKESVRLCYDKLISGLNKYPNNITLLSNCIESGLTLAYPKSEAYDAENGDSIYQECVRQANIVIKHGKNSADVLRAHMIMVMLHSSYGNIKTAQEHADKFPVRSDMSAYNMYAYIANSEKDYHSESVYRQYDFLHHLEAMLNCVVELGCCYYDSGLYDYAQETFSCALGLIKLVCGKEDTMPTLHHRECGDIYALLSKVYLKEGNAEEAVKMLQNMVKHDLSVQSQYKRGMKLRTPLLRNTDNNYYNINSNIRQNLLAKLDNPAFDELKENEIFLKLIKKVNEL